MLHLNNIFTDTIFFHLVNARTALEQIFFLYFSSPNRPSSFLLTLLVISKICWRSFSKIGTDNIVRAQGKQINPGGKKKRNSRPACAGSMFSGSRISESCAEPEQTNPLRRSRAPRNCVGPAWPQRGFPGRQYSNFFFFFIFLLRPRPPRPLTQYSSSL